MSLPPPSAKRLQTAAEGEIKVPIYTFQGACEAEKEMNPVAKVSSLRQFHCLHVGENVSECHQLEKGEYSGIKKAARMLPSKRRRKGGKERRGDRLKEYEDAHGE